MGRAASGQGTGASRGAVRARPRARGLVLAVALVSAAAGCGGARPEITVPGTQSGPTTPAVPPGSALRLASVTGVGRVLVDGDGFTLYLFVPDHRGPTRCDSLCLAEWPPLLVPTGSTGPAVGAGLDSALVGSDPLPGGGRQITYGGWPLYLWAGDTAAGQANGEGVINFGGPWWAVSATGQAVEVRTGL